MDNSKKKKKFYWTKSNTTIVLLIIVLMFAILIPTLRHYLQVGEARDVLRTAKTVQMASRAVAYQYRAESDTILDASRPQGIKEDAEKSILELMTASGEIQRLEFDETTFQVKKLTYMESDFCAVYDNTGDNPSWVVYKLNKMLDF